MKGFTHSNTKDILTASYDRPPFKAGQMMEMPRTSAIGMSGDSKKLTANAKYGVDGYEGADKIVEMPRETMASVGGSGPSSLTMERPMYGVGGQEDMSYGKECYGVSGVGGGGGQGGKRSSLRSAGGTR